MYRHYTTDRLVLRTMSTDEAHKSLDFYKRNQLFLQPYEPIRTSIFYTLEHHQRILRLESEDMDELKSLRLWLYKKSDTTFSTPIGNFAFSNIIRGIFQSCFLGYKLDEAYTGQGYMSEALLEGLRIIFEEYKLHRVEANIMPKNLASMNLAKRLSFTKEGLAKNYLRVNGQWEDHIHMVMLNE